MSKRNLYLNTRPVEEAIEIYTRELSEIIKPQTETKLTSRCLGLVTSEAVYACCCSPLFNAAAMDGIAVRAADTKQASENNPLILQEGQDYIEIDLSLIHIFIRHTRHRQWGGVLGGEVR